MAELTPIVKKYIELRDRKAKISADAKAEIARLDEGMEKIERFLLAEMDKQGLEALPTGEGTPYKSTKTSVTVADWPEFLNWVKEGGRWEMLTRGASKDAVKEFREANDDLPPGLNWREEIVVNVRRT
jgi:hypothetical protein